MVVRKRVPPEDALRAEVIPWELEEGLYGVSYERPGHIFEDFAVGSQDKAAAVARDINAKVARRMLTIAGGADA
jgi:hypothetical protein